MSVKNDFVKSGIRKPEIDDFLRRELERGEYSHSDIVRTPVGIRITIYANKPGLIIGRGGEKINKVAEKLKKEFNLDNPRIDIQEVKNPYVNSQIVAEEIKNAIERGINFRRIGNIMLRRTMESGAIGAEIKISGKLGSAKAARQRFSKGYLKYSGETAKEFVDVAKVSALTKAGSIGISVRIMKEYPEAKISELRKSIEKKVEEKPEVELKCPFCGKIFEKERSLKIHVGQKHSDETEKKGKQKSEEKKEQPKEEVAGE